MLEPTERELLLAAEIDAGLLAIEGDGLSGEEHTRANQALIAGKLAAYRAELFTPNAEARYDEDGSPDEVVTRGVEMFHMEYMAHNRVWMALYWGVNRRIVINLSCGSQKIRGTVESDAEVEVPIKRVGGKSDA